MASDSRTCGISSAAVSSLLPACRRLISWALNCSRLPSRSAIANATSGLVSRASTSPGVHHLARLDVHLLQPAGHVDVDHFGVARLDLQQAIHVVRQRDGEHERQNPGQHRQRDADMRAFHLIEPPGNVKVLAQLPQRLHDDAGDRRRGDHLADDLQPVRFEHLVQEPQDRKRHDPAINGRGDGVDGEEDLIALRQKRIFRLFEAQAPLAQLAVEDRAGLLPQVGNFEDVARGCSSRRSGAAGWR